MTVTLELTIILQNISRRVVGNVLINIPPSNMFLILHLPAIFHQNCQAVLAAVSINGLKLKSPNKLRPVFDCLLTWALEPPVLFL